MKQAWLICLFWGSLLLANNQQSEINVNSRYTIESVEISGEYQSRISAGLRKDIARLIGEKFSPAALDELSKRIRQELRVRAVTHRVLRGATPEHVKVVFEVKGRPAKFDVSIPKFLYHTKQGWSAAVEGATTVADSTFTFGLVSDDDELAERYTGLLARYENKNLGTEHVRLRFQFESYHQQWNRATLAALDGLAPEIARETSGTYRTRQNFEPVATIVLARPLTFSVGTSFQRFQTRFPAAHTQAANAVISTLRYHRHQEASGPNQHDLDAGYSLRAATRILNSDFAYLRHRWEVRYAFTRGRHVVLDDLTAGLLTGQAPLFERYVLGNSSTLRGWNKFDLDPLGSNRMVHNSVEYRYGFFQIFYDTGAVWDRGQAAAARHSIGLGLREGGFYLAVAFPVRSGRAEPAFMVGMNY